MRRLAILPAFLAGLVAALLAAWPGGARSNYDPNAGTYNMVGGGGVILLSYDLTHHDDAIPTLDAWTQRTVNTKLFDSTGSCTLSSNQFTVPAGTWHASIYSTYGNCQAAGTTKFQTRLYNVTDSAVLGISLSAQVSDTGGVFHTRLSVIEDVFTITATKTLELEYYYHSPAGTKALGWGTSHDSSEVDRYVSILLRKDKP